ncbi:MAG: GAF domain-containing protein [Gemmatimonadota bacterium]|nr:GAF domain-containing protein [Gemmatimonadota bacterium]
MEQIIPDLRGTPKGQAYAQLHEMQQLLLEGSDDVIAAMATTSALLHHAFQHLWTGFYRVVTPNALLRVGPYQGSIGCLEISFGRGVCGTAAAEQRCVVVPDVHVFPGHITCDPRSQSEIVVPVFDAARSLMAVLDIDSPVQNSFTEEDRVGLELLVAWFQRSSYVQPSA